MVRLCRRDDIGGGGMEGCETVGRVVGDILINRWGGGLGRRPRRFWFNKYLY